VIGELQRFASVGINLLIPKPEPKEEEPNGTSKMFVCLRQHCILTSSDDPEDTPGYNAVWIELLNGHPAWKWNIESITAASIHDYGRPLVNLTGNDDEACPSNVVQDEPTHKPEDPQGKNNVSDDDYRHFHDYYRGGSG
jgi:hypothetical protein